MANKKLWCVYMHINKINNKKYIGITCNIKQRWRNNGIAYKSPLYKNRKSVFWDAIQKYGWNNFDHVILECDLDFEEAKIKEQYYIKKYETFIGFDDCNGYNATLGGEGTKGLCGQLNPNFGNHILSGKNNPMYGIKPRERMNEETYHEWVKKHKINMAGENNPMYGKTHTEISKNKIRQANYNYKKLHGHGACYGIPKSEAHKNKLSQAHIGKKLSKEHIENIKKNSPLKKRVVMYDKEGNYIRSFESIREAGRIMNIGSQNISLVCKGKGKTAGGYIWRYADEVENNSIVEAV